MTDSETFQIVSTLLDVLKFIDDDLATSEIVERLDFILSGRRLKVQKRHGAYRDWCFAYNQQIRDKL